MNKYKRTYETVWGCHMLEKGLHVLCAAQLATATVDNKMNRPVQKFEVKKNKNKN